MGLGYKTARWETRPEVEDLVRQFELRLNKRVSYTVEDFVSPYQPSPNPPLDLTLDCRIHFQKLGGLDSVELGPHGLYVLHMFGKRAEKLATALMSAAEDLGAVRTEP